VRAFKQERPDADAATEEARGDHGRLDAVRSWLASGHHIFGVDPRRRRGHHGHARQLLADDLGTSQGPAGDWTALASALDRHTVRGGMTELSAEERQVITLAYLEGRTNSEIAAILGVSVSTVRRRLWMALKRLDAYISHTRTWLSAIVLLGAGYLVARAHRLQHAANSDWTQKLASTLVVGAVTAAAVGVAAVMPDSPGSGRSLTPAPAPMIAAAPRVGVQSFPALVSNRDSPQTSRLATAGGSTGDDPIVKVTTLATAGATSPSTGGHHANRGCDGNPTSAAPPVPVGRHAHGSPVTHPSAGGCRA
jgi:DNA-binding CsgD family transcriptional regulator